MACGVPVIATRGGATEEIVREGETGLLVPPGDAERLAEAILALLRNPQRSTQMGRSARAWVEGAFDVRAQIRRIEELYDSLLS
jgi:glycosyltransferase involved in cell wall biosynthesis